MSSTPIFCEVEEPGERREREEEVALGARGLRVPWSA
jgi:hypothetical protein